MSQLRVGAVVEGPDGPLGKVDALIVDPTTRSVTLLVVAHDRFGARRLVPVDTVREASPERVVISLDAAAFDAADRFDEPAYDVPGAEEPPLVGLDPGSYFLEPYVTSGEGWSVADVERIPRGDISIRRGDEVLGADGARVGHVDELMVDPADGGITHLVLRQGHVFRHDDDVVIPIAAVASFGEGRVELSLGHDAVEALPKVPVQRHHHLDDAGGAPDAAAD